MICELEGKIFDINEEGFDQLALDIFHFQYHNNVIYKRFTDALNVIPESVKSLEHIPFLPISFFKSHEVKTTTFEPEVIFESSGTTGSELSRHFVKNLSLYRKSHFRCFEFFYGPPSEWCILALLPSYLERKHSSLVLMADDLIKESHHLESGFYVHDLQRLHSVLMRMEDRGEKALLIGVSFALLDLADHFPGKLTYTIVMETGGMKGRRKEITRDELHKKLQETWGLSSVHAEYGMTELLSQAYSKGDGLYECPPWMKILLRREDDPLDITKTGEGIINIIDLANLYSCSFIATDDIGKLHPDKKFEVLGRLDHADVRGCNLLIG